MCRQKDYKDMCKKTCQCYRKRKSSYDKPTKKYSDSGYGKQRTAQYTKEKSDDDKTGYGQGKSKSEMIKDTIEETIIHFKKFVNSFVDNHLKKMLDKINY